MQTMQGQAVREIRVQKGKMDEHAERAATATVDWPVNLQCLCDKISLSLPDSRSHVREAVQDSS